ncbi:MAG: hypothetical protein HYV54_01290 [Parcubacteria group bacterium]|nr:hypothetical protein [Parcubacteria group bacterium]
MISDSKKISPARPLRFLKFYRSQNFWALAFFFILSLVFHFSSPNIPDPDSFYHIKHAEIYRTEGITFGEFPWTQYSAIKTNASDIWYGFHILLIPFSIFGGAIGIKLAGVFLTFLALSGLWFVFCRYNIKWPAFWPVLIFISAPNIMNRFLMMRPHLLSLTLTVLFFSYLIRNKNQIKHTVSIRSYTHRIIIFTLSFLISWIHLSLVWIPFLVFGVVFLTKWIVEKVWLWREIFIVLFGAMTGWLLRPNPMGSLKLAYIQVIQLILEKQNEATLLFGRELFPLSSQTLFQNFSAFMLLWFLAMGTGLWLWHSSKNQTPQFKTLAYSSLVLSIVFFFMTILVARRAHDFWIPFGAIFIALIYTNFFNQQHPYKLENVRMFAMVILMLTSAFLAIYTPWRNSVSLEERAIPPDKFKEAALWLKENSQAGDIVFNVRWSDFPMLFYWNQKNYYIGGMDPIFQYAYDTKLYWRFHYLSADEVTKFTCPAPACTKEMLEDTYAVLKNDFKAKYVFLEKQRNPLVYYYLESTPNLYEKKIDTISEAVYEIR